ncbi:MAG: diguanylate cyclase [Coriobacteriia bacterium]
MDANRQKESSSTINAQRDSALAAPWRGGSYVRLFSVVLIALLTIFTITVFVWLGARSDALLRESALEQARSYADTIIAARAWNSKRGGVYLKKSDAVQTNPYLEMLGVTADDKLSDGTPVTLRNPAAMTREIGDQLKASGAHSVFKLTSLKLVNPDNAPDEWERQGLEAFETGTHEYWWSGKASNGDEVYRYMRPLVVDESCLKCHKGYKVGDIRGALSVTLPFAAASQALRANQTALAATGLAVLAILLTAVFGLVVWLQRRLRKASAQLEHMASTDGLTGLWNRRHTVGALEDELARADRTGQNTGVLLGDIDHFKRFNDACGHATGDEVLRLTAQALREAVRPYDIVGRVGGEEFLVIAPDLDEPELASLGERIRATVEAVKLPPGCTGQGPITISIGTALVEPVSGETADSVVGRADRALYVAKDGGRNRVKAG